MRPEHIYAQFGPEKTAPVIKYLLICTGAVSLICALLHPLFNQFFGMSSPLQWLSLSWNGLTQFFLWQPFTYVFIQDGAAYGISLSFLIALTFNLYLLWILGSTILEKIGNRAFLTFYFSTAVICGLITLVAMRTFGVYGYLSGPVPILLALFMIWACLYADSEILLFFVFPVKTKWILTGIILALFLVCLSHLDIVSFLFYGTGIFLGYLYSVTVLGLRSPFEWTHYVDDRLTIWYDKIAGSIRKWRNKPQEKEKSKIFDIKTGNPVMNDDQFIDAMLSKISRSGEKSLTAGERRRMREISENKNRENL